MQRDQLAHTGISDAIEHLRRHQSTVTFKDRFCIAHLQSAQRSDLKALAQNAAVAPAAAFAIRAHVEKRAGPAVLHRAGFRIEQVIHPARQPHADGAGW